jgi:uncharacterized protein (TIGR02284 family)
VNGKVLHDSFRRLPSPLAWLTVCTVIFSLPNETTLTKELLHQKLGFVIKLDIDAAHAYSEAIRRIEEAEVRQILITFLGDHQRHVDELSTYLEQQGIAAPTKSVDVKGFLIAGFVAVPDPGGTRTALEAMEANEEFTNRKYREAAASDLPPGARDILLRGLSDESRHLFYVRDKLTLTA